MSRTAGCGSTPASGCVRSCSSEPRAARSTTAASPGRTPSSETNPGAGDYRPAMRAVVQRVSSASVSVEGREIARIGQGLLALVGVGREDGEEQARELASRVVELRIFPDADGRMNRSLLEAGGALAVVSQ